MQEIGAIVLKDPAIDHMAMRMGGSGSTLNDGTMYITLKPLDQRTASADQVIRRLQVQTLEGSRAPSLSTFNRRRTCASAGRSSAANAVPVHAAGN